MPGVPGGFAEIRARCRRRGGARRLPPAKVSTFGGFPYRCRCCSLAYIGLIVSAYAMRRRCGREELAVVSYSVQTVVTTMGVVVASADGCVILVVGANGCVILARALMRLAVRREAEESSQAYEYCAAAR